MEWDTLTRSGSIALRTCTAVDGLSGSPRSRWGPESARMIPRRARPRKRGGRDARLRAENAGLLKVEQEWQLEREILRRAAVYFVGR